MLSTPFFVYNAFHKRYKAILPGILLAMNNDRLTVYVQMTSDNRVVRCSTNRWTAHFCYAYLSIMLARYYYAHPKLMLPNAGSSSGCSGGTAVTSPRPKKGSLTGRGCKITEKCYLLPAKYPSCVSGDVRSEMSDVAK